MIRIGKLTDYGILIMTHLGHDPERLHASQEIAGAIGVPLPTVNKLLKMLSRSGLLESHRGTRGGYLLARCPSEITMADLVVALEGPVGLTDCGTAEQPGGCGRAVSCLAKPNWQRISQAIVDALAGVTLAELCLPHQPIHFYPGPAKVSLEKNHHEQHPNA